ncbi:MAG: RNA polymerase subunit sigma, partial [Clostridiaceae bacterium]|nr:RNA polymerase subunit sigma [Clostridiaceae bacterium]
MLFISTINKYTGEFASHIVERIKNGDKQLKEKFIEDYIPFILKVISSFYASKKYNFKDCDEYSIGLMAFDEAIEKFDYSKSKKFFRFAEMVIKRRLIDYYRNISNISKNEIPFSYFNSSTESEFEDKMVIFGTSWEPGRYELIYELKDLSEKIESFGLSISKLPEYVPKHKDSKNMCINIAKKIIENKDIFNKLKTKKYFQ